MVIAAVALALARVPGVRLWHAGHHARGTPRAAAASPGIGVAGRASPARALPPGRGQPATSPSPASGTATGVQARLPSNRSGAAAGESPVRPSRKADDPASLQRAVDALAQQARADKDAAWKTAREQGWKPREEADGQVSELMAIRDGKVYVYRTENVNAAITTAADQIRNVPPYNLNGSGTVVGVWDAGSIRATHQEFSGRAVSRDGAAAQDHSTHVGGTIGAAGVNPSALGMAPSVALDSYDWDFDTAEMSGRAMSYSGQSGKIQLSNHSYGHVAGWQANYWYGTWGARESDTFGIYNSYAAQWDGVCYNAPFYLPFKSAGNDRMDGPPGEGQTFYYFDGSAWIPKSYQAATDPLADGWDNGGYDTIADVGIAKNIMTVGAVNPAVSGGVRSPASAAMTYFSGWGPADDGRVKPDIVADGWFLFSCVASGDAAYDYKSGTSMSSPNAAGSAALLVELHRNLFQGRCIRASTLKGLIIHTADDLGNPGPDYAFGWGLMNAKAAADHMAEEVELPGAGRIVESSLSNTNTSRSMAFLWDRGSPIRVTLCWTDPPGPPLSGLDNPARCLVNDLDLRVVDPSGQTNLPYVLDRLHPSLSATHGDNNLDNVEQVVIPSPAGTGTWTVIVKIDEAITNGAQDYSLLVSGSTIAPLIQHTPLVNTTDTTEPYAVDATILPRRLLSTNALEVLWTTAGGGPDFATSTMVRVSNDLYRAEIPAQPLGSVVRYQIRAVTTNGYASTEPANAPASLHSFEIVPPVSLVVGGSPDARGAVWPGYGTNVFPSGVVVQASASLFSTPQNGVRYECLGWEGSHSVPGSGATNAVSFALREDSALTWQWRVQYALDQTSSVAGLVATTTWCYAATTAQTLRADAAAVSGGTNYCFAQWMLDGARQPDATNTAVNPIPEVSMATSHVAVAMYLPENQDADGDGMADWWEYYHFGSLAPLADGDADGDGVRNVAEFLDRTDPRDSLSVPVPPVILHSAMTGMVRRPAPWDLAAAVTDNFRVASVLLRWQRNGGTWQEAAMATNGADTHYVGILPAPGSAGDAFSYMIVAADNLGLQATNGPYAFNVVYPVIQTVPADLGSPLLLWGSASNLALAVTNSGNDDLAWTLTTDKALSSGFEGATNGWTHGGANDLWHVSTNRAHGGQRAWYCGNDTARQYVNSMDARLTLPPVQLELSPRLVFWHWASTELEGVRTNYAWDGGIVEISTNGGASFGSIAPVGGYPFRIVSNPASPFSADTPCFAGTGGWQRAEFDLGPYAGLKATLRLRFGSDGYVTDEGWFVDDLSVEQTNAWLHVSPTNGVVSAGGSNVVTLSLDAGAVPSGRDVSAVLTFRSNDPTAPTNELPLAMRVRSRPAAAILSAVQTSTNGTGQVTVRGQVWDVDSDSCELQVSASTNGGAAWADVWVQSVQSTLGAVGLTNGGLRQVTGIGTTNAGAPATNVVTVVWSTTNGAARVPISTNASVRLRVWDGVFYGDAVTSQPFLVDNDPPGAVAGMTSSTHAAGVWSTNRVIRVTWSPAGDGMGIGVGGYQSAFTNVLASPSAGPVAVETAATSPPLADGTNWWVWVRAIDQYGNAGEFASAGPYRIDATPPASGSATITVARSSAGPYVVGSALSFAWSGFQDSGSGLAGYYFAAADRGGSTNGQWALQTTGMLWAVVGQTNMVFVWAQDAAGMIGSSAHASVLVLDPAADSDADGMSNGDEETAGTDAIRAGSRLAFGAVNLVTNVGTPALALEWSSATGRLYRLLASDLLGPSNAVWVAVPEVDGVPGTGLTMTYRTNAPPAVLRFYRLSVELAPP